MKQKMDEFEKGLLESFEQGELKAVKDPGAAKKGYQGYAADFLKKNKRINIRIAEYDLKAGEGNGGGHPLPGPDLQRAP